MAKNKLSDAEAQALLAWLDTLEPVQPTAAIGNVSPDTKKPNKGLKRFLIGAGGEWGDLKSPKNLATGLANAANEQLVQPVWEASKMKWADPSSGLSPTERLAQLMGDALVVGSSVVPAAKGVSKGVSLLDDLARLNEARYMYGIHVSPSEFSGKVKPGSKFWMDGAEGLDRGNFGDSLPGYSYFFNTSENPDTSSVVADINEYINRLRSSQNRANVYAVRAKKSKVSPDTNFYVSHVYSDLLGVNPSAVKAKGPVKIVDSTKLESANPRKIYNQIIGEDVYAIPEDWKQRLSKIIDFSSSKAKLNVSKSDAEKLYKSYLDFWTRKKHQFGEEGWGIRPKPPKAGKRVIAKVGKPQDINTRLSQLDENMKSLSKLLTDIKTMKEGPQ